MTPADKTQQAWLTALDDVRHLLAMREFPHSTDWADGKIEKIAKMWGVEAGELIAAAEGADDTDDPILAHVHSADPNAPDGSPY